MDGNSSAKRVDGTGHADERVFISQGLIPPAEVDHFKDDVATRPGAKKRNQGSVVTVEALPIGDDKTACTNHWVVANTISEDTVKVFEQTGIFIGTCRHAIIETLIEMRR